MANVNLGELNYEIGCREVLRACGRGYFSSKISHFKPQEVHMKPYKFILSATLLAMFATTLYGQEMRTFGVGIYDTIFNNSTDRLVQIEVYALGAGGGGQGGNQHQFSMSNGTGGAGGGGAAVYSKFAVTGPVQFNISVGSGGSGGGYRYVFTGDWQSGDGGGDGNPTIVTWNETNSFTVEGGKGAPRASRTDQSGGTGGRGNESIRPSVVPD
ncbi:MAG: hypothetical protein FWC26_09720, partial [Fibromonadales bacterium]|nr:hypothetical protein [Fibromonadales bacterium]